MSEPDIEQRAAAKLGVRSSLVAAGLLLCGYQADSNVLLFFGVFMGALAVVSLAAWFWMAVDS